MWGGEWRGRRLCLSGDNWSRRGGARSTETAEREKEGRAPDSKPSIANGPARGWARKEGVVVKLGKSWWGGKCSVDERRWGGEGEKGRVIYSCEWVCCPQGLLWRVSKGKGATKTGFSHLNKRMEVEIESGGMIMAWQEKREAEIQLLCFKFRAGGC